MKKATQELFNKEIILFQSNLKSKDFEKTHYHLGRAHILSQKSVKLHLYTHLLMLQYALQRGDMREIFGQMIRLVVTIPGHLIGRVPKGNIGWSTVGLTEEMDVPKDLEEF